MLQVENDSTFYLHVKNEEKFSVKLNSLIIDNIEKELIDDLYLGFNEDKKNRLNNYFQSNILKNIDNLFLKYEVKFLNKSKFFNKKIYYQTILIVYQIITTLILLIRTVLIIH